MNLLDTFYFFAGYMRPRPFHNEPLLQGYVQDEIEARGIRTFFETGTYRGDTLNWVKKHTEVPYIFSVESKRLYYWFAVRMVALQNQGAIFFGDSSAVLKRELPNLNAPVLFWLDAHYGTLDPFPLKDELKVIKAAGVKCLILIDDFNDPKIAEDVEKPDEVFSFPVGEHTQKVAVLDWMR